MQKNMKAVPRWVKIAAWVAFFALLFALADFGMSVYSVVTLNKWDDCSSTSCVSSGCYLRGCYQNKCVATKIEGCCEDTADCVADTPSHANYTLQSLRLGSSDSVARAYEVYQFNMTLYGPFTTNQTAQATVELWGNTVFLHFYSNVSAACTRGGVINSDPVLPARFRPSYTLGSGQCNIPLSNNGTSASGCFTVGSDGMVTIGKSNYDCTTVFLDGTTILKPFSCLWTTTNVAL